MELRLIHGEANSMITKVAEHHERFLRLEKDPRFHEGNEDSEAGRESSFEQGKLKIDLQAEEDPELALALVEKFSGDPDSVPSRRFGVVLARKYSERNVLPEDWVIPVLRRLVGDQDPEVAVSAVRAVFKLGMKTNRNSTDELYARRVGIYASRLGARAVSQLAPPPQPFIPPPVPVGTGGKHHFKPHLRLVE